MSNSDLQAELARLRAELEALSKQAKDQSATGSDNSSAHTQALDREPAESGKRSLSSDEVVAKSAEGSLHENAEGSLSSDAEGSSLQDAEGSSIKDAEGSLSKDAEGSHDHLHGQFGELIHLLEKEVKDLPTVTCLAVFSLGILLGRLTH